jgi:hypothetical protein
MSKLFFWVQEVLESMGHNRLISYSPQENHILKLITMAEVKTNVENSEFGILKVALTYSINIPTTPKHFNGFNMR